MAVAKPKCLCANSSSYWMSSSSTSALSGSSTKDACCKCSKYNRFKNTYDAGVLTTTTPLQKLLAS
eukprot:3337569-Amphidinium_carterae.2